jgi:hypothetical protein
VIDNSKHENARPPDYVAIDRQLVNMAVPNHGEKYAEVPQSTDEKKAAKEVMIKFSAPRQDKSHNGAIQEKADKRCYGGS